MVRIFTCRWAASPTFRDPYSVQGYCRTLFTSGGLQGVCGTHARQATMRGSSANSPLPQGCCSMLRRFCHNNEQVTSNTFGTALVPIVLGNVSLGLSCLPGRPTHCCCCRLLSSLGRAARDCCCRLLCVLQVRRAAFVSYKAVHASDLLPDD